ncbi:MAG TPA: hypothetical protein VI653_03195 [Steroidobacteraceae bacterium]
MRRLIRTLVATALVTACGASRAGDIYVICHSGVSLTSADVRDVFLGEKQFIGSVKLLPADNSILQAAFLDKVIKMDAGKYSTSWTKKSFREGINPPPVKGSDAEALAYVKQTNGACSYVGSQPGGDVVVVGKF